MIVNAVSEDVFYLVLIAALADVLNEAVFATVLLPCIFLVPLCHHPVMHGLPCVTVNDAALGNILHDDLKCVECFLVHGFGLLVGLIFVSPPLTTCRSPPTTLPSMPLSELISTPFAWMALAASSISRVW